MSWLGKVRFFLGSGGGGFEKFWYFFLKEVLALPCVLTKKTPDPPPLGDWQNCDPPLTTTRYVYAIETSRNFACGRKMFEHKYISILNVSKLKQENANSQCFRAEVWIWKHKLWDWVIHSPATPTPRPYPDYSKLPDFYRLPGTKTLTSGRKPDDYQPRAQIKQMFQEGKLKAGDKKAIKQVSEKYMVSKSLLQILLSI